MIKCPPFNTTYTEWIPYQEGDTIILGNDSGYREYVIHSYVAHHMNNYPANSKCGGCNDRINLLVKGGSDSLDISFRYFSNEIGASDIHFFLCNKYQYKTEQTDSLLQCTIATHYKDMPKDTISNITIKKGTGITVFSSNREIWKLIEHRKSSIPQAIKIEKEDFCH
ncbi:hypothetical protein D0T66_11900 [Dysgonomonas sp. 25]|nr:hypothetical protein [Dysgonomonas sp. 25]